MTRTAPSPSLREKISRYDGRGSDSPFTEILLELAELETNDQLLSGKCFHKTLGNYFPHSVGFNRKIYLLTQLFLSFRHPQKLGSSRWEISSRRAQYL